MEVGVIGGSGFLGSHTADALSDAGHSVRLLDKASSPWRRPDQDMVQCDLLDYPSLVSAVSGCVAVYNFAALSDLNEALSKPIETIRVNILGAANVKQACVDSGVEILAYASSVYVNSRQGGFYGCSKRAAEDYAREYANRYGIDCRIARYGSLFGPRAESENGLFRIIKQALETGHVTYVGNRESIRQYIYVEDAASASVDLLSPEFANSTTVLSGRESVRVLDLLEMLREMLGISEPVRFQDQDYTGHYIRTPYASREPKTMRYSPSLSVELEQGLLMTISAMKADLNEQV